MAFDVEAAKADGYTDQEIQAYLASQGTPTPAEAASAAGQPVPQYQPIDRSEEYTGLAQGVGLEGTLQAAKIAGLGAAGGYGLKKIAEVMRGPVAPTPPATPGATQRIMSQAIGSPTTVSAPTTAPTMQPVAQAQQPSVVQRGVDYAKQMQKIAAEKVMAGARAAGPAMATAGRAVAPFAAPAAVGLGAMTFSGGLNTNEEEELRRRRAMAPTITR